MTLHALDWLYKSESSFHNEFTLNSQQLLFINIVIFSGVVLYFVLARVKTKKARRDNPAAAPETPLIETPELSAPTEKLPQTVLKPAGVFFAFNGHEWNAFEILGCGPNEDLAQVTAQYQSLLRTSDTSTFDFYEAAYRAILKSKRT